MTEIHSLIIGFGSIGQRHGRILGGLGHKISVVSRSANADWVSLQDVPSFNIFDYIVISNETGLHATTLKQILSAGFNGKILVEKPVATNSADLAGLSISNDRIFAGYNLRFHPCVVELKKRLQNEKVFNVEVSTGQYLPNWRPQQDYKDSYSTSRAQGGGVIRDLSHELDLAVHLFGKVKSLVSDISEEGPLGLETEEACFLIGRFVSGARFNISLDYHYKPAKRKITVTTQSGTFVVDLVANVFSVNGSVDQLKVERDETYLSQHLDVLGEGCKKVCSYEEAYEVVTLIEKIEESARKNSWVEYE